MKIFEESLDKGIWDAIENGPFVPKFEKDGSSIDKPWSQWTDSESKKAKCDCIAKIRWIIQGLSMQISKGNVGHLGGNSWRYQLGEKS